jgi:hypothetical protein
MNWETARDAESGRAHSARFNQRTDPWDLSCGTLTVTPAGSGGGGGGGGDGGSGGSGSGGSGGFSPVKLAAAAGVVGVGYLAMNRDGDDSATDDN